MQWNLLVIEDDKALSDGIRLALQDAQHRIVQAETLHPGGENRSGSTLSFWI